MHDDSFSLRQGMVHLWLVDPRTIVEPRLLAYYRTLLSAEEMQRYARFVHAQHQHEFLVARALVRTTLSHYSPTPPHQWLFHANAYGRPEIAAACAKASAALRFNLSHTHGLVALLVGMDTTLGVDVEFVHRGVSCTEVAQEVFSRSEINCLNALHPEQQRQRFFHYWTLKEAYIKARGMGLALPLKQFSFHLRDDHKPRIEFDGINDQADHWHFTLTAPTAEHWLATAVQSTKAPEIMQRWVVPH